MIRYAAKNQGKVSTLVIYKVDRFARNSEDYFALKVIFERYKINIQSATEAINDTPEGEFMEAILAAVAQHDNSIRAIRTTDGMKAALESGRWIFGPAWGFKKVKDKLGVFVLTPDVTKADAVKFVYEQIPKGVDNLVELSRVASKRFGVKMSPQLLKKILSNPIYCGRVEVPEWNIAVPNAHEPIISEQLYYKVQHILNGNSPHAQRRNWNHPDFPLRGLLCNACGNNMTGYWTTGKTKKRYAYYVCGNRKCEKCSAINKQGFEDEFSQFLRELVPNLEDLKILEEAIKLAYDKELGEVKKENSKIEREIKELEKQKAEALSLMIKDPSLAPDLKELREKLDFDIQNLKLRQADAGYADLDISHAIDFAFTLIKSLPQKWEAIDVSDFKVLRKILFPKNLTYCYPNFQTPELPFIYKRNQDFGSKKETLVGTI